jgi:hypothetical protein
MPPGCAAALHAMARLRPTPNVPQSDRTDPLALGEHLLDHVARMPIDPALAAVIALLYPTMRERVQAFLLREHYFFDVDKLTASALTRVFTLTVLGERQRPLDAFLDRALERFVDENLDNGDLLIFTNGRNLPATARIANQMARYAHHGEFALRRAFWKMWVEQRSIDAAAEASGIPLERLEFLTTDLMRRTLIALGIVSASARDDLTQQFDDGSSEFDDEDELDDEDADDLEDDFGDADDDADDDADEDSLEEGGHG